MKAVAVAVFCIVISLVGGKFYLIALEKNQTDTLSYQIVDTPIHGLRTPNEGIYQRNLKIWVDVAEVICFGRT